jgi:predicted small secreted protein
MKSQVKTILTASVLAAAAGAMFLIGCDTWHAVGKDVVKAGDAIAGEGKYEMTVRANPDKATAAARKAVEQLNMTDVASSIKVDNGEVKGEVKATTSRMDSVRIDIEPFGADHSKVTIYTHGGDADDVSKQIQDRINRNL